MARIRSVHPDICTSETMAGLSAELERTFVRLWTHCDDAGRCLDNPRLIKAALFPLHDDVTPEIVREHLDALERTGMIQRYVADGQRIVVVRSWAEYQHPKHPTKSKLPEPTGEYLPPSSPPVVPDCPQGVVVGEGVGDGGGEGVLAPVPARGTRAPDVIWNALLEACGITGEISPSARGAYNRARADLAACNATPDAIRQRAVVYRMRWPNASLTPTALARRWSECEPKTEHMPARKLTAGEAFVMQDALENP